MKKSIIMIMAVLAIQLTSCVKSLEKEGIHVTTLCKGRVIEKSENAPIQGVTVSVSDGTHVHASSTTNDEGRFELEVNFNELNENYSLCLECLNYPSMTEALKGMGQEVFDYKDIVFFDKGNSENWPTITTGIVSEIEGTTAKSGGVIAYSGTAPIIERGVCWNTAHEPTINNNRTLDGTGSGSFISVLSNLNLNTKYYVRAYAINQHGTYYGSEESFSTTNGLPVVSTMAITNITSVSASTGGNITTDNGFPVTARGVCWGTNLNPTINDNHTTNGSGIGTYNSEINNLQPAVTYYVRAYAINENGIAYGENVAFSTSDGLPIVVLDEDSFVYVSSNSNFTNNSLRCTSSITSDGGFQIISRGVCWSTFPNPSLNDNHTTDGNGSGFYYSTLTGLNTSNTYYIRPYATNSTGTKYGEQFVLTGITQETIIYNSLPKITMNDSYGGYIDLVIFPELNYKLDYEETGIIISFAGFNDWDLPSRGELNTMYANRNSIGGFMSDFYWFYDYIMCNVGGILALNFANGEEDCVTGKHRARFVRRIHHYGN